MTYQVLARKWRPQNFRQMVGQEHVLQALIHALEKQRLHHAYLFTGTRGVGKTTIGRILAKCLCCDRGITPEPCGECSACVGITEGRYVDLIEIDAASRTKVEDMRELLENVQYAPTEGRFKIYLIDEVHMLSTSSFNALLKTLEEPPEHIKFLFATTDPQKLPVTILSRCLQFNLKNMSPERIVGHLKFVLGEERIPCDDGALWALARAADGSMRDALSLTDQAIAYGNHRLEETGVAAMLGTVDQKRIYRVLYALVTHDARRMLDEVRLLAEFSPDYGAVLATLASILHRIAVEQVVPGAIDNALGDQELVRHYARSLIAEDVQLFYQIALVGRKDMAITPDPKSGLEMALLRMLAFRLDAPAEPLAGLPEATAISGPESTPIQNESSSGSDPDPDLEGKKKILTEPALAVTGDAQGGTDDERAEPESSWIRVEAIDSSVDRATSGMPEPPLAVSDVAEPALADTMCAAEAWALRVRGLGLSGMTLNLLLNSACDSAQQTLSVHIESGHFRLLNANHESRIREALSSWQPDVKVVFVEGLRAGQETPSMWYARRDQEQLAIARAAIHADPVVQRLVREFDARIIDESIRPTVPEQE
jgi:DNA polymerase-3 subunit gamma/tau